MDAIKWRNDRDFTEMHPRCRSRKAHENQTGDYGEPKHAQHDLEHGDQVPIEAFRIHVAVANSRKRFHAKEISVEKRGHLGHTVRVEYVEPCKSKTRLRTGTPQFGYVLPCRRQDGTAAILKLSPDAHGAQEQATALSACGRAMVLAKSFF
jgi:hypothetical protein